MFQFFFSSGFPLPVEHQKVLMKLSAGFRGNCVYLRAEDRRAVLELKSTVQESSYWSV